MIRTLIATAAVAVSMTALAVPAAAHPGHYDRADRAERHDRDQRDPWRYGMISGKGARLLIPTLGDTREGQRWVLSRFDRDGNHRIGEDQAHQANRLFMRTADRNRDGRVTNREMRDALDGRDHRYAGRR